MYHSTVKSSCWRNLKISSFLILLGIQYAQAQSWKEVNRKSVDSEIVAVSTDFQENIYVALADDQLIKLDKSGEVLVNFSQPNLGPFTSLEAHNSLNPFLFIRDNQQVVFLDRFLANPVVYDLNQWTSSFVWLAAPSVDRQLWLLESDPFRITKVDRFTGNVLHEVFLQIGLDLEDLVYFIARQQQLILVDHFKGIYIFDLFGNLIRHVTDEEITSVQLINDQLIYYSGAALVQLDLTLDSKVEIPISDLCSTIIKIEEALLCVTPTELVWWESAEE